LFNSAIYPEIAQVPKSELLKTVHALYGISIGQTTVSNHGRPS